MEIINTVLFLLTTCLQAIIFLSLRAGLKILREEQKPKTRKPRQKREKQQQLPLVQA